MTDVEDGAKVAKAAKTPAQRSYFTTNKLNRLVLDDGLSYIEHKLIDEGTFEQFQDLTSTVKLDSSNTSTEVDLALGRTRRFLLENLVVSWNLVDDAGNSIPYAPARLMELPPNVIAKVVEDIYSKNTILRAEADAESESGKKS